MSTFKVQTYGLLVLTGMLASAPALAQTYQSQAYTRSHVATFFPGPSDSITSYDDYDYLNKPEAKDLHHLSTQATYTGGSASAQFLGSVGTLKAQAHASYVYCCSITGQTVAYGYSDATAQGSFFDTVHVQGAGLSEGTAVTYRVDFRIDGTLSSPSFEMGGFLSADGIAQVRLRDMVTFEEVSLNWDAKKDTTGLYSLTLQTQVGHDIGISGMLYAGASVSSGARAARSADADFYHSAHYYLSPSIAGLNTVGASGHDFLATAVPEPETWAMLMVGLSAVMARARKKRQAN
jgi:PEP-CTERM motif